jgi:hypothetical protein
MPNQSAKFAQVGKLSAVLVIVVMLLGGIGLFGIYSQHRTVGRAFEAVDRVRTVEFALRELEVDFKVEVQEWKNVLLRGQTEEGYAKWRATYEGQVRKTKESFTHLRGLPGITAEEIQEIEAAASLHDANAKLYAEALSGYLQNNPESIYATDQKVRGKDRAIAHSLDELGDTLRDRDKELARQAQADGEQMYQTYRTIAIVTSLFAIAVTLNLAISITRLGRLE